MDDKTKTKTKTKKHSIGDKIAFGLSFVATLVLFVLDKSTHFIYKPETKEGLDLLIGTEVISCLSFFFCLLSFAWDKKLSSIKKSILIGNNSKINCEEKSVAEVGQELAKQCQGVQKSVAEIIKIVRGSITDSLLSEKEEKIVEYFNVNEENDYIIIYIITNSINVELDEFQNPIRKNILNDVQYVYMTPLTDDEFHVSMKNQIIGTDDSNHLLNAAYIKNIHHISNPDYFVGLPDYSDMVIYKKKQYIPRGADGEREEGYFCFQNGAIEEKVGNNNNKIYYYQEMNQRLINNVLTKLGNNIWNSVCCSYMSPKLEIRVGNIGKGVFVKEGESINKDDVLFIKGGYFLAKEEVARELVQDNTFLQINKDKYLGGINTEQNECRFYANHSCKANCILRDEITFVASEKLNAGDEVLVNYRELGINYGGTFTCAQNDCPSYLECQHDICKRSNISKRCKAKNSLSF